MPRRLTVERWGANSGDHGVDLTQAYASTDEASVSLEYSELEEAQLAEEEAEKAVRFLTEILDDFRRFVDEIWLF